MQLQQSPDDDQSDTCRGPGGIPTSSSRHRMQQPPDDANLLDAASRADLVRKSRKLAQLFGQTPEPRALSVDNSEFTSRRHSSPLTPDQFSFISQLTTEDDASYVDLEDEEQVILVTPEQQAEDERRRKREKLAKLHRFLGSRVPTNLVLGLDDSSAYSLPPDMSTTTDPVKRKVWLKRRRSSSAAVFPSNWDDDLERLKEDLNDQEKALNVRRAIKMEKACYLFSSYFILSHSSRCSVSHPHRHSITHVTLHLHPLAYLHSASSLSLAQSETLISQPTSTNPESRAVLVLQSLANNLFPKTRTMSPFIVHPSSTPIISIPSTLSLISSTGYVL